MNKKIHLLVLGVNIIGRMASSQRIRNLIIPLLEDQKITVSNLIFNSIDSEKENFIFNLNFLNAKYKIRNPFSIIKCFYQCTRFIRVNKVKQTNNILYCYGFPEIENIWLLLYAKLIGYKIVFDIIENNSFQILTKSSRRSRFKNYTSLKLQKIIPRIGSVCFAISSQLVDYCNKICHGAIAVIHLPISVNIENIQNYIKQNQNNNKIKIFYGGSFGYKDGIPILIKAFELACNQNDNLELILTGKLSKDIKDEFEKLLNNSPASEKINFLGCLSTNEYYVAMANSDILCMTRINSPFANAGFPFKLGEYLASGRAIIATNVGDVSQYITNNENALLVPAESENQLCDAILHLAKDPELRRRLGIAAHKSAYDFFSSKKISNLLFSNLVCINPEDK